MSGAHAAFPAKSEDKVQAALRKAHAQDLMFRDLSLTGSMTASAEWAGANYGTCGVTPHDQYVIIENSIGRTRVDEPSQKMWDALGCEETAPVNQNAILERQAAQKAKIEAESKQWVKKLVAESDVRLAAEKAKADADHAAVQASEDCLINFNKSFQYPTDDNSDPVAAYEKAREAACPTPHD
jgi:hypothetical protein